MVKEMSDSDLEEIIALCHRSKQKAEALAFSAIPPQDHRRISTWYESDFVEGVVFAELNSRQAAVFRPILESQIEAFVGLEIQDYISLLMAGINVLSAEDKVDHLKDLRKELMRQDDYARYNSISAEGLLPSKLDEISRSPKIRALWYSHSDSAIQLESFFSRIEFLSKTVIPGKVISGKVKAIGGIIEDLLDEKNEKNVMLEPTPTPKSQEEIKVLPEFEALFKSRRGALIALRAAVHAGIINEDGTGKLGMKIIVPAIIQFWAAVSDRKFDLTHVHAEKDRVGETMKKQCKAIAMQFGKEHISQSPIYEHAIKMNRGTYFTDVSRKINEILAEVADFQGNYKE